MFDRLIVEFDKGLRTLIRSGVGAPLARKTSGGGPAK